MKSDHLLPIGLDTIHFETKAWISEIKFFHYELSFLKDLIDERLDDTSSKGLEAKAIFKNVENMNKMLSEEVLGNLGQHEKDLAKLLQSDSLEEPAYIKNHIAFAKKVQILRKQVQVFKAALFDYLKEHPFDYDHDYITGW